MVNATAWMCTDLGYGHPSQAQGTTHLEGWEFTSAFDSGNALHSSWAKVEPGKEPEHADKIPTFSVDIARDCHGIPKAEKAKAFWFFFGVTPPRSDFVGEIKLIVNGMVEQRDLISTGYRPWASAPSQPWCLLPMTAGVQMGPSQTFGWHCTWKYTFNGTPGTTRFAFCHPFSYTELMAWLDRLDADFGRPRESPHGSEVYFFQSRDWHQNVSCGGDDVYFHRQTVAHTPMARRVELLTVTEMMDTLGPDELREHMPKAVLDALEQDEPSEVPGEPPLRFPGRPICFISGRVHPGETPGQFAVNGFLQFILSNDPRAVQLRDQFVFKICPMLNPDGVAWGHSRTNVLGFDLNRCYRTPTPESHEGVFAIKAILMDWAVRGDLLFYMDCHGHAARRGCFIFGNHHGAQGWSSEDSLLWNLAYVHAAQLNSPHIDIDACEWSRYDDTAKGQRTKDVAREDDQELNESSRSDSGRAQIGVCCRLYHAYTLECNYNIGRKVRPVPNAPGVPAAMQASQALGEDAYADGKKPTPKPYGPREWAAVGEALAVALLDLHATSPHSRLIEARPPKPLLPPDKDLASASSGLDRLFDVLADRHRASQSAPAVLKYEPRQESTTDSRATATQWLVLEPAVYVVPEADPLQTSKVMLASKQKGDIVVGTCVTVNNHRWLRVDHEGRDGWILIDGSAVGAGRPFLTSVAPDSFLRRRVFKVVHSPHVYIRANPQKDAASLGMRKTDQTVVALEVRGDGWISLDAHEFRKFRKPVSEAYMLIDGKSLGLGPLLADTGEVAKFPVAAYTEGGVLARVPPSVDDLVLDCMKT